MSIYGITKNIEELLKYDYFSRHYYTDRLFSQIIRHFLSYFIAKKINKQHIHWPYLSEEINTNFEKILDKKIIIDKEDSYQNMCILINNNKVISMPDQTIAEFITINELFTEYNIQIMKKAYKLKTHTISFNPEHNFNVAIHIRRGDIANMPYCDRYTDLDFFENTILSIFKIYTNPHIHIYSDSDIKLNITSDNIIYHNDEDLLCSVHDMIKSHIFIMSIGSNMSYFAALLSDGIIYYDKRKLVKCFNNMYNIYWSKHPKFINDEDIFISKIKKLYYNPITP